MEIEDSIPFAENLDTILNSQIFKRSLVLWFYYRKHQTQKVISETTGIPSSTISDIIAKWKREGSVENQKGQGNKSSISEFTQDIVISEQKKDRKKPVTEIHKELMERQYDISYKQTLGIINSNFNSVYAPYKISLTQKNKANRVKWLNDHSLWRWCKWQRVIWTDEKMFALHPEGKKVRVRIMFDESPEDFGLERVQQGGKKVMFWGAISSLGKVYFDIIPDSIDSKVYCDFLKDKALPAIRKMYQYSFIYQHDGAPAHHAASTATFLKKEKVEVLDWPAQSPDLNPIEQVWLWMDNKVKIKSFNHIEELTQYVFDLWEELPENTILSYIKKLKSKFSYVYENNGELYAE